MKFLSIRSNVFLFSIQNLTVIARIRIFIEFPIYEISEDFSFFLKLALLIQLGGMCVWLYILQVLNFQKQENIFSKQHSVSSRKRFNWDQGGELFWRVKLGFRN